MNAEPLVAPAADVVSESWLAAPADGTMPCVAGTSEPDANVSVYVAPASPEIPTVLNVAIPLFTADADAPTIAPPELTVIVTVDTLSDVIRVPAESVTSTAGCVVNAAPLAAPAAGVASFSLAAIGTAVTIGAATVVTNGADAPVARGAPLSEAVITCETFAPVPGMNVTLTAPDASVTEPVLENVPPLAESVQVITRPASETGFPCASTSCADTVTAAPGAVETGVAVTMYFDGAPAT